MKPLLNRDPVTRKYILPSDGWYHLAPMGEFLGEREMPDGKMVEVRQRINNRAIEKMIANFNREKAQPNFAGILLDFDHFSHDLEKSSEAAGWIQELASAEQLGADRDPGLWARIDLTDAGEPALVGGRYRKISGVWDGPEVEPGVVEPHQLFDAGLTNKPNLRGMVPLSNRAGRSSAATQETNHMQLQASTLLAMVAALGLPPESTDEQITAALPAVKGILNRGNSYAALETKYNHLLDSVATSDLAAHGITDEEEIKVYKPMLISNREGTLKLLARGKKKDEGKPGPIHNRANKATPENPAASEGVKPADEARAARISNRARELRAASPGLSLVSSYQSAEAEITDQEKAAK